MKLMALYETSVFLNEGGGVTISQTNFYNCGRDKEVVILYGDQVELVMLELQRLLKENKFTMEMPDEGEVTE